MTKHYNNLSLREKEAHNRPHEPPTRCPECDIAVQPEDLVSHLGNRCQGRADPHPRSRWISSGDAQAIGVSRVKLSRMVSKGEIRKKGKTRYTRYLLRDVVRYAKPGDRNALAKPKAKGLTRRSRKRQNHEVKTQTLKDRVTAFVAATGSYSAASRKLDVPIDALMKAGRGEVIRKGTQVLIEKQLDGVGRK